MEHKTIGQRIAACRKELNLSQMGLGEKLGVSRQAISKWEADAAIPEIDKLIALSRLFGISVGWLLGVEEGETEASEEEPEEFTARERELIDALTKPRPLPRWQKIALGAVAVCAALSVVLSGGALYRAAKVEEEMKISVQNAMDLFAPGISMTPTQLEDYTFTLYPEADGASIDFQAVPTHYREGMTAKLIVTLDGQEVAVRECEWDGSAFLCALSLKAANGYEPSLVLTDADGVSTTSYLVDQAVANLAGSMHFSDPAVKFEDFFLDEDRVLHLQNVHVQVGLPAAWRDVKDAWVQCDLVAYADSEEMDRVDLLNRSAYSKKIDFSGTAVDLTTREQRFDLSGADDGDRVRLVLECKFHDGQTMQHTVREWELNGAKLAAVYG